MFVQVVLIPIFPRCFGLGIGLRQLSGAEKVLHSTTAMATLLQGLIGSGGQSEKPTRVKMVEYLLIYLYFKLEKFQ